MAAKAKAKTQKQIIHTLPFNKDPVSFCTDLLWDDPHGEQIIAEEIGISRNTVWYWKNDPPTHAHITTIQKILKYYGWEIHYKRVAQLKKGKKK